LKLVSRSRLSHSLQIKSSEIKKLKALNAEEEKIKSEMLDRES
jgi:hypothetical protein